MSSPLHDLQNLLRARVETWLEHSATQIVDSVRWARTESEHRVRLRTLQRDLDFFWIRLGKTAFRLAESGEIQHVGLDRTLERIQALQDEIRALNEAHAAPPPRER